MPPHIRPQATVDLGLLLSDLGVVDRDTAAICGVAVKTVRRWRRLYQRRGVVRGQQNSAAPCPRCDGAPLDEAAYSELLGWYLGDGHIVRVKDSWLLSVSNDRRYPELNAGLLVLMSSVKGAGSPNQRSVPGAIVTQCGWKHWTCVFPQHGPGRKHTRPIVLEEWQRDVVERHPGRFLRGLFHSDGCRNENWTAKTTAGVRKRYTYGRWFFSNKSEDILALCEWALDIVGAEHRRSRPDVISVAKRASVAMLDEVVRPKA